MTPPVVPAAASRRSEEGLLWVRVRRVRRQMPGLGAKLHADGQDGKNLVKQKSTSSEELMLPSGGSDRRRSGDLSIFSRTLYQLSYRA